MTHEQMLPVPFQISDAVMWATQALQHPVFADGIQPVCLMLAAHLCPCPLDTGHLPIGSGSDTGHLQAFGDAHELSGSLIPTMAIIGLFRFLLDTALSTQGTHTQVQPSQPPAQSSPALTTERPAPRGHFRHERASQHRLCQGSAHRPQRLHRKAGQEACFCPTFLCQEAGQRLGTNPRC